MPYVKIIVRFWTFVYTIGMSDEAPGVLGEVLRRARQTLNRSPEQVGALVGISGRTVRRLEAGAPDKPRRVTLEALAGFYGLNPDVIVELAEAESAPDLLARLREQVAEALGPGVTAALEDVEDEAVELAMRLARLSGSRADALSPARGRTQLVISYLRSGGKHSPRDHVEAVDAFVDFLSLDARRREVARQVLGDLRLAQESEHRAHKLEPSPEPAAD